MNIQLRPLNEGDGPAFFELVSRNSERLKAYFPVTLKSNQSLKESEAYVQAKLKAQEEQLFFGFVLEDRESKRLIGYLLIKNLDWRVPKGELAYFIDRDYEGKGLMSFAMGKLLQYAFEELDMHKLFLEASDKNLASCRVAEKSGFLEEGLLRDNYRSGEGDLTDIRYFGLLKSDWLRLPKVR